MGISRERSWGVLRPTKGLGFGPTEILVGVRGLHEFHSSFLGFWSHGAVTLRPKEVFTEVTQYVVLYT